MKKSIILLTLLLALCLSQAANTQDSPPKNISFNVASTLIKEVSLSNSQPPSPNTTMLRNTTFALYTSQSLIELTQESPCEYKPSSLCCWVDCGSFLVPGPDSLELPFTKFSGQYSDISLYINTSSSSTDNNWWFFPTSTLITDTHTVHDGYMSVVIGMGFGGASSGNSPKPYSKFSVFLNGTGYHIGELLFDEDLTLAKSKTPSAVLTINEDLHVQGVSGFSVGNHKVDITYGMIFDMNTDGIKLPQDLYDAVVANFSQYGLTNCTVDLWTHCNYKGAYNSLPTLSIYVGDTVISLPPDVYVYTFLNALAPPTVSLYLTPLRNFELNYTNPDQETYYATPGYANYLVLGGAFMKYYYTVFNSNPNTATLYVSKYANISNSPSGEDDGLGFLFWVVAGLLGVGILVAIIYYIGRYCLEKKAEKDHIHESLVDSSYENSGNANQQAASRFN